MGKFLNENSPQTGNEGSNYITCNIFNLYWERSVTRKMKIMYDCMKDEDENDEYQKKIFYFASICNNISIKASNFIKHLWN